MAAVTIRNVPEEIHRGLKTRAMHNGRSTEAEIREILKAAVLPDGRVGLGSALFAIGQRHRGVELDIVRDKTPAAGASFD